MPSERRSTNCWWESRRFFAVISCCRCRTNCRRVRGGGESHALQQSLARVHRAFDETAGRTLFEADLADFFEQSPQFEPLRDAIGAFYAASRTIFFLPDSGQGPAIDLHALRRLCLACRDAERGVV